MAWEQVAVVVSVGLAVGCGALKGFHHEQSAEAMDKLSYWLGGGVLLLALWEATNEFNGVFDCSHRENGLCRYVPADERIHGYTHHLGDAFKAFGIEVVRSGIVILAVYIATRGVLRLVRVGRAWTHD